MIKFIETVNYYEDTWNITFYFLIALALLIGIFWTVFQSFKNSKSNKLSENTIYNNPEDVIEQYEPTKKGRESNETYNNYAIPNRKDSNDSNTINYYEVEDKTANKPKNKINNNTDNKNYNKKKTSNNN